MSNELRAKVVKPDHPRCGQIGVIEEQDVNERGLAAWLRFPDQKTDEEAEMFVEYELDELTPAEWAEPSWGNTEDPDYREDADAMGL